MQLPVLSFSYNWNGKLYNKAFTTIRMHNEARFKPGNQFDIQLNRLSRGTATVVAVKPVTLAQINDYMAYIDTGYGVVKCRGIIETMYKNKKVNFDTQLFDFVLLAYVPTEENKQ